MKPGVERRIVGYQRDQEGHWVAELECGHTQHVRHEPPWQDRPWVVTEAGRNGRLGTILSCRLCGEGKTGMADESTQEIAERVRRELVRAALAAYEDAGLRGLCAEGAWEVAVAAMRAHDLSSALARRSPTA